MSDIRRWELASADLFSRIPDGRDDRIVSSLVKIHVAMTKFTWGLIFHEAHPGYEAYLPEFTTIVTLVAFNLVLCRHFPIPQYPLPFRHRDSSHNFQRR